MSANAKSPTQANPTGLLMVLNETADGTFAALSFEINLIIIIPTFRLLTFGNFR
jgi:hypothetical protein